MWDMGWFLFCQLGELFPQRTTKPVPGRYQQSHLKVFAGHFWKPWSNTKYPNKASGGVCEEEGMNEAIMPLILLWAQRRMYSSTSGPLVLAVVTLTRRALLTLVRLMLHRKSEASTGDGKSSLFAD